MSGRALARNGEVTLIDDTITKPTCSVAPPATATLPGTDVPWAVPTGAILIGVFFALIVVIGRRSLGLQRTH